MTGEPHIVRMSRGTLRILLPDGIGTVDIQTELTRQDGASVVRVDVQSDADRYGPARDGVSYTVTNGDPGPGVVFLTGREPEPEPGSPRYPECTVELTDTDANAVAIFRKVRRELIRYLVDAKNMDRPCATKIGDAFQTEATSGDYDHVLATCGRWVRIV